MTNHKKKFSDEEIWELLHLHKAHLTSATNWNKYAKSNGLPHAQTIIKRFGKWNDIKAKLDLQVNQQSRPITYQKEDLQKVLIDHRSDFIGVRHWNQYASTHKLPTFGVFERQFGEEYMKRFIQEVLSDNLATLIRKEFPVKPPTFKEWEKRAQDSSLPSAMYIVRKYGKWSNMKYKVYQL